MALYVALVRDRVVAVHYGHGGRIIAEACFFLRIAGLEHVQQGKGALSELSGCKNACGDDSDAIIVNCGA